MGDSAGRTARDYEDFWAQDEQPRLYRLICAQDGRPTFHAKLPCGHVGHLDAHIVDEHDDGTFSIVSQPNPPGVAMNSVLCPHCGWHGYVDHNVWRPVP